MPSEYEITLAEHRRRLLRLTERRGISSIKRIYDAAQQELERKLARAIGAGRGTTFTAHQHMIALAQVRQGQVMLARDISNEMGDISREAQVDALRGLGSDIERLEKHYKGSRPVLPIHEAAVFAGVIDKRKSSLMRMHEATTARMGARTVAKVEEQLAVSLASGESSAEAVDRVQEVTEGEFWQAERIVRTEVAYAQNAATADGIEEIQKEVPEMRMRWTEHVTDDGEPMDDRVGADSIAMHAQLDVDGVFTMPDDAEGVWAGLLGETWDHPPNRPNDRSVLTPWMLDWGVPAWEWRGAKVWLVES